MSNPRLEKCSIETCRGTQSVAPDARSATSTRMIRSYCEYHNAWYNRIKMAMVKRRGHQDGAAEILRVCMVIGLIREDSTSE